MRMMTIYFSKALHTSFEKKMSLFFAEYLLWATEVAPIPWQCIFCVHTLNG